MGLISAYVKNIFTQNYTVLLLTSVITIFCFDITPIMTENKQKRTAITLETKVEILDRLKNGEGSTSLGRCYNLGESTIRAIKKHECAIRNSIISGSNVNAKLTSYTRNIAIERTEKALVYWMDDLTQKRIPIDGHSIKQKALRLYNQIIHEDASTSHTSGTEKPFSASTGWLTGFLKRNSYHNLKMTGENACADVEAAKTHPEKLLKIIEDGGYWADRVLSANETGLFWKRMRRRTYIAQFEKNNIDEIRKDAPIAILSSSDKNNEDDDDDDEVSAEPAPLTANSIREGLQIAEKLENYFLAIDRDSERSFRFQRELNNCIAGYRALHKSLVKSSQTKITTKEKNTLRNDITTNERPSHLLVLPSPSKEQGSTSDASDFTPVRKRSRRNQIVIK